MGRTKRSSRSAKLVSRSSGSGFRSRSLVYCAVAAFAVFGLILTSSHVTTSPLQRRPADPPATEPNTPATTTASITDHAADSHHSHYAEDDDRSSTPHAADELFGIEKDLPPNAPPPREPPVQDAQAAEPITTTSTDDPPPPPGLQIPVDAAGAKPPPDDPAPPSPPRTTEMSHDPDDTVPEDRADRPASSAADSDSDSSVDAVLRRVEALSTTYWDQHCSPCEELSCPAVLSYDDLIKRQGQAEYACRGAPTVGCCSRISADTRRELRHLVLRRFAPWLRDDDDAAVGAVDVSTLHGSRGIPPEDIAAARALVRGNHYSSFLVEVVDGRMKMGLPQGSIHWHHDIATCSANRNDMLDGRRLNRSIKSDDGEGEHFQDRPGNRLRMKNFLQLVQHFIRIRGQGGKGVVLAVSSGDGAGPYPSSRAVLDGDRRPFPSLGVLSHMNAPSLTFPKHDNERDPDLAVWDQVRRGWTSCASGTDWQHKEAKACFRGAIRQSAFCNDFTETGRPDRTTKVSAENWKDVSRTRMLWLRQEAPDLFDVNFSDLERRVEEIGIDDAAQLAVDEPARLSMHEQSRRFKYLVNVEGNQGWADRTRYLLLSESVAVLQHTPSHEWFEDMLVPETHYLATDSNLRNLSEVVDHARRHDADVEQIGRRARAWMSELMSVEAQTLYASMVFELLAELTTAASVDVAASLPADVEMRRVECRPDGECWFEGDVRTFAETAAATASVP